MFYSSKLIKNPDTYFNHDYAIDRLLREYGKHKQLIVALDFDDTIFDCHQKGHTYENVISLIKECNKLDFRIIIFTASKPERFPMMVEYCEKIGIKIEAINKNVEGLPHGMGTAGKIYYNILLDDRAGLESAFSILDEVVKRIKLEKAGIESF